VPSFDLSPLISCHPETHQDTLEATSDHKPQASWWRNIYNRISQSGSEHAGPRLTAVPSKRKHRLRRPSADHRRSLLSRYDYDEPPPPSAIRVYRHERRRQLTDPYHIQPGQAQVLYQHRWPDRNGSFPLSEYHNQTEVQATVASAQSPQSPLFSSLGNAFGQSDTNCEPFSESESRGPGCVSASLDGLMISQPSSARPAVVMQSQCYESEIGDIHADSYPPAAALVAPNEASDPPQDIAPPVPPKSPCRDQIAQPRRPSHRRESAQHRALDSPLLSPPLPPSPPPDWISAPTRSFGPDPDSIQDIRNSPTEFVAHLHGSGASRGVPLSERNEDLSSPRQLLRQDRWAPAESAGHRDTTRVYSMPSTRFRQNSLPVPAPYPVPVIPGHVYPRQRSDQTRRRMSAPLGDVPPHSAPTNSSSVNRTSYRPPFPVNGMHNSHSSTPPLPSHIAPSGYPKFSEVRSSRPFSHIPRIPVMPQPLAQPSQDTPHTKPRIHK
jgi:hypothetical protein